MNNSLNENAWKETAEFLKMDEFSLKDQFSDPSITNSVDFSPVSQTITTGSDKDLKIPFEVSFLKILGIKGELDFKAGENWSIDVVINLLVLGNVVRTQKFRLDKHNVSFCLGFSLPTVYFNTCFGVRGEHICFYLKGEVGVWLPFKGWERASFDENIVCLKP